MAKDLLHFVYDVEGIAVFPLCLIALLLYYRQKNIWTFSIFIGLFVMAVTELPWFITAMRSMVGTPILEEDLEELYLIEFFIRSTFTIGLLISVIGFGGFSFSMKK